MSDTIESNEFNSVEITAEKFENCGDFLQHASEAELRLVAAQFAVYGFRYLKESMSLKRLPILKRIEYAVSSFKNTLNRRSAAIAEFNNAYHAGGMSGGRTQIREAINAFFSHYVMNFPNIKKVVTSIAFDVIKSKKFVTYCDESFKFFNDIVRELKADKDAWGILHATVKNFSIEAERFGKDVLEDDPLEFQGTVTIYDSDGKLKSAENIEKQFNESYCELLRNRIKTRLRELRFRYDDELTDLLKKGIPAEKALVELSKKYNGVIPAKIVSEGDVKKDLASEDPDILKTLFESLV